MYMESNKLNIQYRRLTWPADVIIRYCILYISWPKGRKAISFSLEMLVVANYTNDMHLEKFKIQSEWPVQIELY